MKNSIPISVIIPTYNRGLQSANAIDSVINQSMKPMEIIIVDDGSTDNTRNICESYHNQIIYHYQSHTGIPGQVRNEGIRIAKGEWIAFLDSDDQWQPNKLYAQLSCIEDHKNVVMFCTNANLACDQEVYKNLTYFPDTYFIQILGMDDLLLTNWIITSSTLIRRDILLQTGVFSESIKLKGVEDYDLWLKISVFSKILFLAEPLILYRSIGKDSIRKSIPRSEHYKSMLSVLDRIEQFYYHNESNYAFPQLIFNKKQQGYRYTLLKHLALEFKLLDALRLFIFLLNKDRDNFISHVKQYIYRKFG